MVYLSAGLGRLLLHAEFAIRTSVAFVDYSSPSPSSVVFGLIFWFTMHSAYLLPLLAGLAASQSTSTDIPADAVPTPDSLPLDFLRDIPAPTYTTIEGVLSQDVPYATATAIESAAADVSETPLSVFPAVTTVPINAAGESDAAATGTPSKRGAAAAAAAALERRAACDSQATIANYYDVDVSSYASFKADTKIAQVANDAATPSGYFSNFKNKQAANSACTSFFFPLRFSE